MKLPTFAAAFLDAARFFEEVVDVAFIFVFGFVISNLPLVEKIFKSILHKLEHITNPPPLFACVGSIALSSQAIK